MKKIFMAAAFVAIFMAAAFVSTIAIGADGVYIVGMVLDQNKDPIDGAVISVYDSKLSNVMYGEGITDSTGNYNIKLNDSSVGRHVDIYYQKGVCKRQEFGLLIPFANYASRPLYTYMTVSDDDNSNGDSAYLKIMVYDYPSGIAIKDMPIMIENAYRTNIIATGTTNANGVATIEVPMTEVNVYANLDTVQPRIYPGQELGVHPVKDTTSPVSIYVGIK